MKNLLQIPRSLQTISQFTEVVMFFFSLEKLQTSDTEVANNLTHFLCQQLDLSFLLQTLGGVKIYIEDGSTHFLISKYRIVYELNIFMRDIEHLFNFWFILISRKYNGMILTPIISTFQVHPLKKKHRSQIEGAAQASAP